MPSPSSSREDATQAPRREPDPDAGIVACVARLIDLYGEHKDNLHQGDQYAGWDILGVAAIVARTPVAPLSRTWLS